MTSLVVLATFQVPSSHRWLVASTVQSVCIIAESSIGQRCPGLQILNLKLVCRSPVAHF